MENCVYGNAILDLPIVIGTYPIKDGATYAMNKDLNEPMMDKEKKFLSNSSSPENPSAPQMPASYEETHQPSAPPYPEDGEYLFRKGFVCQFHKL